MHCKINFPAHILWQQQKGKEGRLAGETPAEPALTNTKKKQKSLEEEVRSIEKKWKLKKCSNAAAIFLSFFFFFVLIFSNISEQVCLTNVTLKKDVFCFYRGQLKLWESRQKIDSSQTFPADIQIPMTLASFTLYPSQREDSCNYGGKKSATDNGISFRCE